MALSRSSLFLRTLPLLALGCGGAIADYTTEVDAGAEDAGALSPAAMLYIARTEQEVRVTMAIMPRGGVCEGAAYVDSECLVAPRCVGQEHGSAGEVSLTIEGRTFVVPRDATGLYEGRFQVPLPEDDTQISVSVRGTGGAEIPAFEAPVLFPQRHDLLEPTTNGAPLVLDSADGATFSFSARPPAGWRLELEQPNGPTLSCRSADANDAQRGPNDVVISPAALRAFGTGSAQLTLGGARVTPLGDDSLVQLTAALVPRFAPPPTVTVR